MRLGDLAVMRCPRCRSSMKCAAPAGHEFVQEGILSCASCSRRFPVVAGIPILWDDLGSYLKSRYSVGMQMLRLCRDPELRRLVSESMPPDASHDARGSTERRWAAIYGANFRSHMYRHISNKIAELPVGTVLEHGCSVGTLSRMMAKRGMAVTGVDRSFPALLAARRRDARGLYLVADSAGVAPSGRAFDAVVSLNMLEVVEPGVLLEYMASQSGDGYLVVADPYDYSRGDRTVDEPLGATALRRRLLALGFALVHGTAEPSFVPWNIRINPRTTLRYLVDLVVAKKL